MCQYFSCIVTRDLKVHWSKTSANHEDLIAELKLQDVKLHERDFVRIEITPKDTKKVTRNREDWQFQIDEDATVPKWFKDNRAKAEEACWLSWEESVKVNLILPGEEREVKDLLVYAYSAKRVVARGLSHVEAWDSSHVEAWDSSHVVARGLSHVEAWGSSHVVAWDSSHVVARDSSHVEAWGLSHVEIKSQYATVLKSDGKIYVLHEAIVVKTKTGIVEA